MRKGIILGIIGTTFLVGATIVPIVIINNNNDKKDKEDVEAVIKILESKTKAERTLKINVDSTGKIIADNKEKVIAKIKELIKTSKLRGVSIEVSMEVDSDISIFGQAIIVKIKKGKHSQQIKGVSGIEIKRDKNVKEIKVESIQNYFKDLKNLELLLPKTNYDNDDDILTAIKRKIFDSIKGVSFEIDEDLITKKEGEDNIESVANHNQASSEYKITIGKETFVSRDFTLKLNQEKLTRSARLNISVVETIKNKIINKDITLLAATDTSDDGKILAAIKTQLQKDNSNLSEDDLEKITDNITTLIPGTRTTVTLTITAGTQTSVVDIHVTRPKNRLELIVDINEVERLLNALTSKEVIITETSGSITTNKNSIFRKLQSLSGYPSDLKGVAISIKEEETEINLEGVVFTIELSKGSVTQELRGFTVKRSQSQSEIDQNDINEVKNSLSALTSKEVIITETSGSITTNKNSILGKLQSLSGYPSDLKGVTISIKEEETEINLEGVAFIIELSKGSVTQELRGFTVKRSQTDEEIIDEVKQSLESLTSKEVIITETSGSITTNKNSILGKLQSLSGYPSDLKGVTISIKEEETEINLEGIAFTIELSKGSVTQELRGFTVKRSQKDEEIIDEVKQSLESLTSKEVIITETSGSITTNKNSILGKIQSLSGYPSDLKGVTISIKEEETEINLEGVVFTIELSKGSVTQELREFTVKRSQNPTEINQNDVDEIKQSLESLTSKEVIITETSGSITTNKNSILGKLQSLSGYPSDLKGVTISIKEEETEINLEGIAFTIELSKGSVTQELRGFTVKRSQKDEEIIDEVKQSLESLTSKEVIITETSGSITTNKNSILGKIQSLSGYPSDLKGVTISIKEEETEINLEGVVFTIELSKGSVTQELRGFTVKRSQTDEEIIDEVKQSLESLTSKEVIITETSGSITTNKNSILGKIQSLSGYPSDLKGVTISIKEEETEINLEGVAFIIELSKGSVTQELRGFTVKRSQTDEEIIDEVKQSLESLTSKEVIITETSGSITTNKNSILGKLQSLSGYPSDLKGVTISIKEEETEINLEGIAFTIELSKGSVTQELRGFTVKRSQKDEEIIDEVKQSLESLTSKEVIITETSGSITTNKNSILGKIQSLSGYPSDLKGVTISIKEEETEINLEGVVFTIELSKGSVTQELRGFTVKRSQKDEEIIDEVKQSLESLTSKEVIITETSGSITTNKNSILGKIQSLSGYPSDLKGVTISIKEEETEINLEGVVFTIELSKGSVTQELRGFTVKRSQNPTEINQNDVDEIKQSLESLTSKEVIITETSGSITTNKNSILGKLQSLSGYPSDLKGVTISIKEEETEINLEGIAFTIELSKGSVTQELRGFTVKRSQKDEEIIDEVKQSLESLTSKEVIITETSGSITTNKNSILGKLQSLSGYPSDLKGVTISIKEEETEINLEGVVFTIELSKGSVTQELRGFTVKRSQKDEEIIDEVKQSLESLTSKEVIITETSGSITTNKNSILGKLQSLSGYPSDLKGVTISIKEEETEINLEGVAFIIELSKGSVTQELRGFTVKRSQTDEEIIDEVKQSLESLTSKEVIITETSGSITTNKNSILGKLQSLSGYPSDLKGVTISIKEEETEINLEGIAFTIELSKGSVTQELRGFTVKRSQKDEEIIDEVKQSLESLTSKEVIITETSGSITTNKNSILGKLQSLSGYPSDLKGVTISIKEEETEINLEGVVFTIELSKGSVTQELRGFTVKRSQSQTEINQNDVDEIKKSLESLTSKEVIITETSGSITTNKNSILGKLQSLSGYPSDLKGVTISIKEEETEINLEGVVFTIELSKGDVNEELRGFTVKRSQTDEEIIDEVKNSLNALTSKEVTIDESSGSIATHKNSILGKIEALSDYPLDLKGVSLSIKDSSDLITLEGVAFIIELLKGDVNEELRGFTVKRSQTQPEIQSDINEVKNLLNALTSKEVTIDESSGSIATHKNSILGKIEDLSDYPSDLKGVTISIKEEETEINLEGVVFTIELSKGSVTQELRGFTVKRSQTDEEIIDEVKNSLNALTSKEVTIDESSGSITTNKNSILGKLQSLSGYPSDLKGVTISIKEEETEINLEGIAFTIELSKGSVTQELRGFTVKRSQKDEEIIDEVKQSLESLTSKEVIITETSGSITTNKNSILGKIQSLSGYPSDLKGVTISIKEEETEINLEGVVFTIELSKGSVTQELRGFTVKRSQSPTEINQNDVDEIKQSLESLTSKEVIITETSGSITTNKNSILGKLQSLSSYPSDLKGVTISIKEEETEINLEGVVFTIELSKGSVTQELRGFTVKRSQTDEEIIDEVKQSLESLTSKEVIITETSGSITTNKNSILGKIQSLSGYPSDLKGVTISIKEEETEINLEGVVFTIELSKGSVTQELRGFTVKRSQSPTEINQNDVDEIKQSLESLTSKEVIITETSGSITTNKNSILGKLQSLSGYPSDLKGVTISIKEEETEINLEGIAFTIELSKGDVNEELRGFTVKRSQKDEEIIDEVKQSLESLTSKEVIITETSGSITTNKNSILGKIQSLSGYPSDLKGVTISIKEEETEINLEGVAFTIELSKGSVTQELRGFIVKRSQSPTEINQNDVDEVKQSLESLTSKEVIITETSGSITTNKNSILGKIQSLSGYPSDLKGVSLSIKDSSDLITLEGVSFIIQLSKGIVVNQELTGFIVKRSQSQFEIEENNRKIKEIASKIRKKGIILSSTIDTSDDAKILAAIKDQLKIDNDKLSDEDLEKITDDITTLIPETRTPVTLTITIGPQKSTISIFVEKLTYNKEIENIKSKITNKDITLPIAADTSDDAKILVAIKAQLKEDNDSLIDEDLEKIIDDITTLTPGTRTPVTLTITVETQSDTVDIHVLKLKTVAELDAEIKAIKDKIKDKDITLVDIADNSDDAKILAAIKTQLNDENNNILSSQELEKITADSIPALTLATKIPITLTITVGTQSDTINIQVRREE